MGLRAQKRAWAWEQMFSLTISSSFSVSLPTSLSFLSIHLSPRPSIRQSVCHMSIVSSVCPSIGLLAHPFAHSSNVLSTSLVPTIVLDPRVH